MRKRNVLDARFHARQQRVKVSLVCTVQLQPWTDLQAAMLSKRISVLLSLVAVSLSVLIQPLSYSSSNITSKQYGTPNSKFLCCMQQGMLQLRISATELNVNARFRFCEYSTFG